MIVEWKHKELPAINQITGKRMKFAPLHILAKWCEVNYSAVAACFNKPSVKWHGVRVDGKLYVEYGVMHRFKAAKDAGEVLKDAVQVRPSYDEIKLLNKFERDAQIFSGVQDYALTDADYVEKALNMGVV